MVITRLVLPAVLLATLLSAAPAAAGWLIEHGLWGGKGKGIVMLQANRMKTVEVGPDGKPTMAFILDLDAETLTQVNYKQREYVTATAEEWANLWRDIMSGARAAQMEEALKHLPPDQRKMKEQTLRSQAGAAGRPQGDCPERRVEFRRTGEQATVAGHAAVRHEVLADEKNDGEVWMARSVPAWRELDQKKLERFSSTIAKGWTCGPAGLGLPAADLSRKVADEGYPMRIVSGKGPGGTREVVKAESRALPASEFQPPAGFARKTLSERPGQ